MSPDYILVMGGVAEQFIAQMKATMLAFYTETPKTCVDVSRIINTRHATRIAALLDDPTITVEAGGDAVPEERYIAPTLGMFFFFFFFWSSFRRGPTQPLPRGVRF